ncbi:MAG: hypothetical protein V3V38_01670 [Nitrosopumilaceae archaeon]|jgi:hypothetical protein
MNKSVNTIALVTAAVLIGSLMSTSTSFADEQESQTEIISIDGTIGIEKTTVSLFASSDNILPWGFVEGKILNHVSDYPVIIQIYDSEGDAVHFAQTNVEDDGSYEYRFRVLSINDNQIIKIFEGDYSVKIFKVIYLNPDLLKQA